MSKTEQAGSTAKKEYKAPELKLFGSIRDLTGSGSASGGDSSAMQTSSDPALKDNIVQVGTHPAGYGLYLFDYKPEFAKRCGEGRRFGVMADEVESIVPEAVSRDAFGYRQVDYAKLGLTIH
ncbi:tail fiber domain-containing protein [Parablastomonas sp. CN1-191]|uniref:tail fiber domain-containing protein n=1 Tax=Parablastomonas sp. CN1-191 TaxID=3400908 RepID=UPI003BF918F8